MQTLLCATMALTPVKAVVSYYLVLIRPPAELDFGITTMTGRHRVGSGKRDDHNNGIKDI